MCWPAKRRVSVCFEEVFGVPGQGLFRRMDYNPWTASVMETAEHGLILVPSDSSGRVGMCLHALEKRMQVRLSMLAALFWGVKFGPGVTWVRLCRLWPEPIRKR